MSQKNVSYISHLLLICSKESGRFFSWMWKQNISYLSKVQVGESSELPIRIAFAWLISENIDQEVKSEIHGGGTSWMVQRLRFLLPMQGVWVWSLVGKLRSHMLCSAAKKIFFLIFNGGKLGIHRNSLYCLCNLSVNLKLVPNKRK